LIRRSLSATRCATPRSPSSGGLDLPTVKRISGHKTLAMVERYAHQNGEHIQAAMDALQNRLRLA
jgi:hypothetical protein